MAADLRPGAIQRIQVVTEHFQQCVDAFEMARPFSGPSLYFYSKAVGIAAETALNRLADNQPFVEAAYAALTAWGMHRMGPGNTKLPSYDRFRSVTAEMLARVPADLPRTIRRLSRVESHQVAEALSVQLDFPGLTQGQLPLVANSKLLHFALPHLVPPIDRTYTLKLFFGTTAPPGKASELFRVIYPRCSAIAVANSLFIGRKVARAGYMCDADAKLVDNAIVGYRAALKAGRHRALARREGRRALASTGLRCRPSVRGAGPSGSTRRRGVRAGAR
jgi:hypothetical protein